MRLLCKTSVKRLYIPNRAGDILVCKVADKLLRLFFYVRRFYLKINSSAGKLPARTSRQ